MARSTAPLTSQYYRDQSEEGKTTRGAINMVHAKVSGPADDKLKFDVAQVTSKYGRLYLKANRASGLARAR